MSVTVLYGNLQTDRVFITEMDALKKTGVQTVIVTAPDGTILDLSEGFDRYAVCYGNSGTGDWVKVFGEDDGDWTEKYELDHMAPHIIRTPLGCLHTWFEGSAVSASQWTKVQNKRNELLTR